MKKKRKTCEFNIHLNEEDRQVVDELIENGINVSRTFKIFIRQHLQKIKAIHENNTLSQM